MGIFVEVKLVFYLLFGGFFSSCDRPGWEYFELYNWGTGAVRVECTFVGVQSCIGSLYLVNTIVVEACTEIFYGCSGMTSILEGTRDGFSNPPWSTKYSSVHG